MWPRIAELLVGLWCIVSPWLFGHAGTDSVRMWNDVGAGVALVVLSMASYRHSTSWAHFLSGLVAVWLIGSGYFGAERPGPPANQNEIVTGLLVLLLFFLPNEAGLPPESWRRELRAIDSREE
jgi:hypothetical protein